MRLEKGKTGAGKWGLLFFQPVGIESIRADQMGLIGAVYKGRENNRIILVKVLDVYAFPCVNRGISPKLVD